MLRYYRRWAFVAVSHAWGMIETWAGVLGLVVPPLAKFFPENPEMFDLIWQIPLCAFGAIVLVRVFLAPWWMHQEQDKKIEALTAAVAEKDAALSQKDATAKAPTAEEASRHLALERLRKADQRLKNCKLWLDRADTDPLFQNAKTQLALLDGEARQILHDEFPEKLNDYLGGELLPGSEQRHQLQRYCREKVKNLEKILDKLVKGR